jgi:hypothetical protein
MQCIMHVKSWSERQLDGGAQYFSAWHKPGARDASGMCRAILKRDLAMIRRKERLIPPAPQAELPCEAAEIYRTILSQQHQ